MADSEAGGIALELRAVRKAWQRRAALDGVDLRVARGSVVGLVGPSGAGKTTAMRVALGFVRPDGGSARVFGGPAADAARWSGRIGLLLDGPALERGLTVADNLRLHAIRHGRPPRDPAALLGALGLGGLERRRAGRLSQGEQCRVALARALLLEPDLLVLDEPVAHLDPALVQSALDLVRAAAAERGAAVLVSSHQLAELERIATHLVLLHRGRALLAGDLAELLGGIATTLRVAAAPAARARAVLSAHAAVARVDDLRADGRDLLRVELAAAPAAPGGGEASRRSRAEREHEVAASVNAALHAAGVEVSLVAPERPTLERLFRDTLERAGAGGERPA